MKRRYPLLAALLVLLIALGFYVEHRLGRILRSQLTDGELTAIFESESKGFAELGYLEGTTRRLRYLQVGNKPDRPLLVFIHGAPASGIFWLGMMRDSALRARTNMLAIDRPGYGGSGLGKPMTNVAEQAENIAAVIRARRQPGQPVVLHGSSYGGTVTARIAMDFPDLVDGFLLMSASTAPEEEYTYWVSRPSTHWSLRWLIPRAIHTANHEKLAHQYELEKMADQWGSINAPAVILHGTDDWLIYPENAYNSCAQIEESDAPLVIHHMFEGKEHDLMWTAPKKLRKYLHFLLDVVEDAQEPEPEQIGPTEAGLATS